MNLKVKRVKELCGYAVTLTKEEGFGSMAHRAGGFFKRRFWGKKKRYLPSNEALEQQRKEDTSHFPLISICVPLYNTPENYLNELLNSVQGQTCGQWQLCLADASDDSHAGLEKLIRQRADTRISYIKIENKGIASNTNAAAALAKGEYLALADHDDVLAPHAVYMMGKAIQESGAAFLYSDEALFSTSIEKPIVGHFKPDFAPEYFLCCNYLCHLAVFQKELFCKIGGERDECNGSQDYDLFLRLIEEGGVPVHVPHVLYYWRVHEGSTSGGNEAKPYVEQAGIRALQDHLTRTGQKGTVHPGICPGTYKIDWQLDTEPRVSILIPNKDHADDLEKCLRSVYEKTQYENYEVIIIENNSEQPDTFSYYQSVVEKYPRCMVEYFEGGFNFSAINNFGRQKATGEYLLMLNNDTEIINGEWLKEMVEQASRPGVAICGAKLYYEDNTVQHGGIITGLGGYAGHSHKYRKRDSGGYMFRLSTVQDFSAVTAACLLVRTDVFDEVKGMDEGFSVAFNDVDFCLRVRDKGYRIVWTPYAELYHYESKSRGLDEKDPVKKARFESEHKRLYEKHGRDNILHDPYYNPSLTLDIEDFSESMDLRNLKNPDKAQ